MVTSLIVDGVSINWIVKLNLRLNTINVSNLYNLIKGNMHVHEI